MRPLTRRAFVGRAVLACAAAGAGCSAAGGSRPAPPPEIVVERPDDLIDSAWSIRLRGFPPASRVEVMATLAGWGRAPWRSWAAFETDPAGAVDLTTAPALGGTYRGFSPMGLFWSMQPQDDEAGPPVPLTGAFPLTLAAGGRDGSRAEITLERRLAAIGVTSRVVHDRGVVGALFTPASPGPHPAVIVLSGATGGLWLPGAALLASRGYAALALGYFHMPGLPQGLVNIPIEYFEAAIEWLRETVRPRERFVAVVGVARGGELALLLGASIRDIGAVVAYVPSGVMLGPFGRAEPGDRRPVAAWTHHGRPLPSLSQNNLAVDWSLIDSTRTPLVETPVYHTMLRDRDAVERSSIPVERIRGPVLLISGKADDRWPSFELAQIAYRRLQGNRHPYPFAHLSYEGAGHGITLPHVPTTQTSYVHPIDGRTYSLGGDPAMTARASADSWPKVLAFLGEAWIRPR